MESSIQSIFDYHRFWNTILDLIYVSCRPFVNYPIMPDFSQIARYSILALIVGLLSGVLLVSVFDSIISTTAQIQAIASVALFMVTGAYVFLTRQLVTETRDAREQEIKPVLSLTTEGFSIEKSVPVIKNIGGGPAIDVNATVELIPDGPSGTIQSKTLAPGEKAASATPEVTRETAENYDSIVVSGTSENIWGNRDPFNDEFNLSLVTDNDGADSVLDRDQSEWLLRQIEKNLRNIAEDINMDGFEKVLKLETRKRILSSIPDDDSISITELSGETGLGRIDLAIELLTLKEEVGMIDYSGEREDLFDESTDISVYMTGKE